MPDSNVEAKPLPHRWGVYGPGDHPRWTRYHCKACGRLAQFHDSVDVERQTRDNCKPKPNPEAIKRYNENQAKRAKEAKK